MDGELESVLTAVGPRLRAMRQEHDLTLAEISATTGISVSTLSRLESSQRRPTLELLLPLARAYGVPVDELVGAPETGDPRVHMRPVIRNGITTIPLTRHAGGLQAFKLIIPPDQPPCSEDGLRTHEGYEWLYVLNGRLRMQLGEHDLILAPGEAAEFDTLRVPHCFSSADDAPVELLCLFGPQGDRAHLRVRPRRP